MSNKNKKNHIRIMKNKLLRYIHDKSGRMLSMTRAERKAENQKARILRKREKLAKQMADLDSVDAATAAE